MSATLTTREQRTTELRIGQSVEGSDGPLGVVSTIVIDPVARTVSHVVIEPTFHRHIRARLVPIELIAADGTTGRLRASIDTAGFRALEPFRVTEFVPLGTGVELKGRWEVADQHVVALPLWYGHAPAGPMTTDVPVQVRVDRVPRGEFEIRRSSRVVDVDGHLVGHVDGIVLDGGDATGFVMRRRLLWLGHEVLVPIGCISAISSDVVRLDVGRDAVDRFARPVELIAPIRSSLWLSVEAQLSVLVHRTVGAARAALRRVGRATTGHD